MSTLTSTLNDLEMNLDEVMMESMAVILGANRTDDDTAAAADTAPVTAVERKIFVNDQD